MDAEAAAILAARPPPKKKETAAQRMARQEAEQKQAALEFMAAQAALAKVRLSPMEALQTHGINADLACLRCALYRPLARVCEV